MPIKFYDISFPKFAYTFGSVSAYALITEKLLEKYPDVAGPALPLLFAAGVALTIGGNLLIDQYYYKNRN